MHPLLAALLERDTPAGEVLHSRCEHFLADVPDNTFDLTVTSPPYENARYYGKLRFKKKREAWVQWMVPICHQLARVTKGPVIINCQGRTEDYRYSGVPLLLFADLVRGGLNARCPFIYYRNGVAGSGNLDYLRNDYEFCLVFQKRPARFPWANPTACGHPPKWAPGGQFSNRLPDGKRINQWGGSGHSSGPCREHGRRQTGKRPSHVYKTKAEAEAQAEAQAQVKPKRTARGYKNGDMHHTDAYVPPVIANPGNVVKALYTAEDVAAILAYHGVPGYGDVAHCLVGGGTMGNDAEDDRLAHQSEAPMALKLADFTIRTWCPPMGLVYDPFGGSGTTPRAAIISGRRCFMTDSRADQCALARRRLARITPTLFTQEVDHLHRFEGGKEHLPNVIHAFALRVMDALYDVQQEANHGPT